MDKLQANCGYSGGSAKSENACVPSSRFTMEKFLGVIDAGIELGLDPDLASEIVRATDNRNADPALRGKLIAACGLAE